MPNITVDANDVINEMTRRFAESTRENAILSMQVVKLEAQVEDLNNQLASKVQAEKLPPAEPYPTTTDSGVAGQPVPSAGQ